jgi:hypothetical protein
MIHLTRENILLGEIKRFEADGVGVGPPASSFQQKFVAEEI